MKLDGQSRKRVLVLGLWVLYVLLRLVSRCCGLDECFARLQVVACSLLILPSALP